MAEPSADTLHDDPDAVLVDVDEPPSKTAGDSGDVDAEQESGEKSPFLKVDDRTVYYSEDEARKAYSSAGKRIAELSRWERQVAKQYGLTPDETAELLEELDARRRGTWEERGAPEGDTRSSSSRPVTDKAGPYDGLSPEEVKSLKWLEARGYIHKSAVEKLIEDAIAGQNAQFENVFKERDRNAVIHMRTNEGRSVLADLLKEAGYPTTPQHIKAIELYLTDDYFSDEADPDEARLDAFLAGGEKLRDVVADGFKTFLTDVIEPMRLKDTASYEKKKAAAMTKGTKPLPKGGAAPAAEKGELKTLTLGGNKKLQAAHNRAWQLFNPGGGE